MRPGGARHSEKSMMVPILRARQLGLVPKLCLGVLEPSFDPPMPDSAITQLCFHLIIVGPFGKSLVVRTAPQVTESPSKKGLHASRSGRKNGLRFTLMKPRHCSAA